MQFVMQRNRTIASTSGHAIEFKKGEPTHVPPCMYEEVMAAGAVSTEELNLDADKEKTEREDPQDPGTRKKALFAVYEKIVLRNRREDFSASGAPHPKVLMAELGWSAIHNKERDATWLEFKTATED